MDASQSLEFGSCCMEPTSLEPSLGFIGCSAASILDLLGTTFAQKWDLAPLLPEALRTGAGIYCWANFEATFAAFQPCESSELIVHPLGTARHSDIPDTQAMALFQTAISVLFAWHRKCAGWGDAISTPWLSWYSWLFFWCWKILIKH